MSGSYLLDTNVAIGVLNRQIDLRPRRSEDAEVFLCLTVLGELYYGASKSARPEENRRRIERLLGACALLPHDLETADRYGAIKAGLRRQGRPIPENDIWIAASALRHDVTLAPLDQHFESVDGLRVDAW